MELYDLIKNISGKNNEEELIKSISKIKGILNGLTEERTCKIYSGFLVEELRKNHVPARLINTLDLGLVYEHEFILIPDNMSGGGYLLADLTFSQFNQTLEQLKQLITNGYQFINDESFKIYLESIEKEFIEKISVEDAFYCTTNLKR